MSNKPEHYPALYVIFTLLSALRHGIERKNIWREFRRQKIALKPRLSFWIALGKQAGLLNREEKLTITRAARAWLGKSAEEQAIDLIEAWQNAPKNRGARRFRKKLLWKLKYSHVLTKKDLGVMRGLEALGLYNEGSLTAWGKLFIKGEGNFATPKPMEPCHLREDHLIASLDQHADLLWDIEKHLRPASPGIYPLTKRALRFMQDDPHDLIGLLERGLQDSLPDEIKARLLDQPSLRVSEGIVLEFSHPADLERLRRQPNLRQHLEQFLSPRHVLIPNRNASALFKILKRRGVYISNHEEIEIQNKRTHFPQKKLLLPINGSSSKIRLLEKYQELQQAIDVLYRVPGYPAEQRRITPLLIEQRGEYTYVSAYCQTRRAQRTFRLDRIEIPGAE